MKHHYQRHTLKNKKIHKYILVITNYLKEYKKTVHEIINTHSPVILHDRSMLLNRQFMVHNMLSSIIFPLRDPLIFYFFEKKGMVGARAYQKY